MQGIVEEGRKGRVGKEGRKEGGFPRGSAMVTINKTNT